MVTEVEVDMDSLNLVAAVQHGAYNRVAKLLESGQSAQDGELSQTNRIYSAFVNFYHLLSMLILTQGRSDTMCIILCFPNF